MNNTANRAESKRHGETEPYQPLLLQQQKDAEPTERLRYDELWFKPLNLQMYLFRNAILGKKKPFFDSEELEIKLTHRRSSEFVLTLKNKTRRELRVTCWLNDDEFYVFSDSDFK